MNPLYCNNKKVCAFFGFSRLVIYKSVMVFALPILAAVNLMAQSEASPLPVVPSEPPPTPTATMPAPVGEAMMIAAPPAALQAPKPTKHEISVSGDFMVGSGTITLPLGYSLSQSLNSPNTPVGAFSVPRNSTYYGGTISYSYGQAWYVDLSYAKGQSSGNQSIDTGSLGALSSTFSVDDTEYQLYLRYAFPQLRGKRFSAYLRGGISYVTANLQDDASSPAVGRYTQRDKTTDILGNLGFGLGYSLYSSRKFRFGLQLDVEGFYGTRSQVTLETLSADEGVNFVSANIDNSLYGVIGRVTARAEYRLGKTGLFKIFGDVGVEGRYTLIDYPNAGSQSEDILGIYAKIGIRYAF